MTKENRSCNNDIGNIIRVFIQFELNRFVFKRNQPPLFTSGLGTGNGRVMIFFKIFFILFCYI